MWFYGFLIFFYGTEIWKQQMLKLLKFPKISKILQKFREKITPLKNRKKIFAEFLAEISAEPRYFGQKLLRLRRDPIGVYNSFWFRRKKLIFENFMAPQNLKIFKIFIFWLSKFKFSKIGRTNFCDPQNFGGVKNRPIGCILNPRTPPHSTAHFFGKFDFLNFGSKKSAKNGPWTINWCTPRANLGNRQTNFSIFQ